MGDDHATLTSVLIYEFSRKLEHSPWSRPELSTGPDAVSVVVRIFDSTD